MYISNRTFGEWDIEFSVASTPNFGGPVPPLPWITGSSILVLKINFSLDLFPRNLPLSLYNGLISRFLSGTCTEVSGVENIGQCGRLSQLSLLTYLLTYLLTFLGSTPVSIC